MQRAFTIAFALAALVLSVMLVVKSTPRPETAAVVLDAGGAAASASEAGAVAKADDAGDLAIPDIADLADLGRPAPVAEPLPEGGLHLADGTPIAPLGAGAPKQVRFGVVLVTYTGAQGAPAKARSRKEALAIAEKLAEDAKADFKAAVQRGDSGSADDAGSVPRGVLEPATEATLFALPVGSTSSVIDTPRGLWIVKRLE